MMEEKNKKSKWEEYAGSFGGIVTGLLFITVVELYLAGMLDDYFNAYTPVWPKLHELVFMIVAAFLGNYFVYTLGMVAYGTFREYIPGNSRIWKIVLMIAVIAACVLFGGLLIGGCGRAKG